MEKPNIIGLDIAKNVFQLHINDTAGKKLKSLRVRRDKLIETFANLPCAIIGMEACGSAHHWARELQKLGHTIKMMAPQRVKAYLLGHKTDARDAAAIAEATAREAVPAIRIKSADEQQMQSMHRIRQATMEQRVQTSNQLRGLLSEFGIAIPFGYMKMKAAVKAWLEQENTSALLRELIAEQYEELGRLEVRITRLEQRITQAHKADARCQLIDTIPGVGVLTATAVITCVGDATHFSNSRQFASYFGLTPKAHNSGDKHYQSGISKMGNRYARMLLIHGARAQIRAESNREVHRRDPWIMQLIERRGHNRAVVALANKNARRIWAMLQTGEVFNPDYALRHGMRELAQGV